MTDRCYFSLVPGRPSPWRVRLFFTLQVRKTHVSPNFDLNFFAAHTADQVDAYFIH
jgi:hypothetical protein